MVHKRSEREVKRRSEKSLIVTLYRVREVGGEKWLLCKVSRLTIQRTMLTLRCPEMSGGSQIHIFSPEKRDLAGVTNSEMGHIDSD